MQQREEASHFPAWTFYLEFKQKIKSRPAETIQGVFPVVVMSRLRLCVLSSPELLTWAKSRRPSLPGAQRPVSPTQGTVSGIWLGAPRGLLPASGGLPTALLCLVKRRV